MDRKSSRPAGRIFQQDGGWIRPSQDCSIRYGYAINFNRINALTETDYSEVRAWSLKPPSGRNIIGTHTWNELGGVIAIDALVQIPGRPAKATVLTSKRVPTG
jgi:hypothetical protein